MTGPEDYLSVTVGQTTTTYDRTTAFAYDLMNQLKTLTTSTPKADAQGAVTYGSESTTNTYNAAGQRVKRFENGKTTKYYYSGSAILFTTDVNNFLQTENVLDLSGGIVASQRFDNDQNPATPDPYAGEYFFYNYDCRGSTTSVIAPAGTLTTGYTYDEFGNQTRTGAADFLNEVTFTGSVSDTASGLQYMNARFYNPSTGRFLTQDSYSGNAYDPWTQHLYSYCGNNPVNMIDPTGHYADSLFYDLEVMSQPVADLIETAFPGSKERNSKKFNSVYDFGNYLSNGTLETVKGSIMPEHPLSLQHWLDSAFTVALFIPVIKDGGKIISNFWNKVPKLSQKLLTNNKASLVSNSLDDAIDVAESAGKATGRGFRTFKELKTAVGSPGENNQWHHIVEQSQMRKSGFSSMQIQNANNIIAVDKATHMKISGFYSSKPEFTQGKTVRDWLVGQSYQEQYKFGIDVLNRFGIK